MTNDIDNNDNHQTTLDEHIAYNKYLLATYTINLKIAKLQLELAKFELKTIIDDSDGETSYQTYIDMFNKNIIEANKSIDYYEKTINGCKNFLNIHITT